jgi:hypothetical protein
MIQFSLKSAAVLNSYILDCEERQLWLCNNKIEGEAWGSWKCLWKNVKEVRDELKKRR